MKPHALLIAFLLGTSWAAADPTTIEFSRRGDTIQVDQNGQKTTVPADSSSSSDFLVPVPDSAGNVTPTVSAAPAPDVQAPKPLVVASVPSKPKKARKPQPETTVPQPASIHYTASQTPASSSGGTVIDPSSLPLSDESSSLPEVHVVHADRNNPIPITTPPVSNSAPATASVTALDSTERKELDTYRALLAHPLEITIEGSQVKVNWNAASGTVAIPPSKKIDIKLDRVMKAASH